MIKVEKVELNEKAVSTEILLADGTKDYLQKVAEKMGENYEGKSWIVTRKGQKRASSKLYGFYDQAQKDNRLQKTSRIEVGDD